MRQPIHCSRFLWLLSCVAALVLAGGQTHAGTTEWIETDGGRLRVVTGTLGADGTLRGMLDIELEAGWKTYWRDPGDSGIPPTVTVVGAGADLELSFPAPERFDDAYGGFVGYKGPVRLPIVFTGLSPETPELTVETFLGICETVCIPVQASFAVDPTEPASPLHAAMVDQAFDALPEAPSDLFGIESAVSGDDVLILTVRTPTEMSGTTPELFVAPPVGSVLGTPRMTERTETTALFEIPVVRLAEGSAVADLVLDATLSVGSHSVSQSVAVQ